MAHQAKQILVLIVSFLMFSNAALAYECKTSEVKKADGGYFYSNNCHLRVGEIVEELELRKDQIKKLEESVTYYNKAYDTQTIRVNDWMNTSVELDKQIQSKEKWNTLENIGYFALGVLVMYGATQAAK